LGKKQKYIVFRVNNEKTEIVVDKTLSDKTVEKYEDFVDLLPKEEPRWAIYDFQYEADGGGQRNKLVLIKWYVSHNMMYV
jgi:cofilin